MHPAREAHAHAIPSHPQAAGQDGRSWHGNQNGVIMLKREFSLSVGKQEELTMAGRVCPQCGMINGPNDRFCKSCGISLTQRLQQSSPLAAAGTPGTRATAAPVRGPAGGGVTVVQDGGQ